ncbi:Cell differentiation family, Rcd1-like containing protein [Trichomonas vaginalis G3]|uniref:Cell differentiation family, Rcd1-like containing protein n=1 Tax=Trichomonas vaginalis (strain ATCC PRA-98 / G3) TaxID=412133 RepID=A2EMP2_TRIV3|nr:positive regulation of nuclear receptor transcription coactivator protein [Trichomonas vaginalis G3]EAY06112.1 Cell differentiation family, Rcd1-like containing protein [Trichomonas vaginalis G3]KAI5497164.1 positive regulation of nuclear receptor transcription coactivator protein [Trichomonas vaginalis G3]|eukprot:XP_001318335.1 Cell differentiation family, Rcd1-like containing protein [Trichomonas vaginalis G3]
MSVGMHRPATPSFYPGNQPYAHVQSPARTGEQVSKYIKNITIPSQRQEAVQYLSINRDTIKGIGVQLWETPAVMVALLSDIMSIYPAITSVATVLSTYPSPLSIQHVVHVCNCIALLQSVASASPEVRKGFISSNMPIYLFPFIHATNQIRECEMLKLASLGVISCLAQSGESESIDYLIQYEFVPLCLRVLKFGDEINKIVASYIIAKVFSDKKGIQFLCCQNDHLETALHILNKSVVDLNSQFSPRLSRNVCMAYESLLAVQDALPTIKKCAIAEIKDALIATDTDFKRLYTSLLSLQTKHE